MTQYIDSELYDDDMPEEPEWEPSEEMLEMMYEYGDTGTADEDDADIDYEKQERYFEQEAAKHAVEEESMRLKKDSSPMLKQLQHGAFYQPKTIHLRRAADEIELLNERLDKYSHPVATGFNQLNQRLNGGLRGLTILGGLSATGKTSFALQIADFVAMSRPVLFFSLEMAEEELICRSISRFAFVDQWMEARRKLDWCEPTLENIECKHTTVNLMTTKLLPSGNSIERYKTEIAANIYFIEEARNVLDIGSAVMHFIQEHGIQPFVVIDYLQILDELDPRKDNRKNVDLNVTLLRRLVRETGCAILVLSSLNRENYRDRMSLAALKESGGIEYSADCVLGLQFAKTGEKDFDFGREARKNPRELECVILKSRMSQAHVSVPLYYKPAYNVFWTMDPKETNI